MELERVASHEGPFRSLLERKEKATKSWKAPLQQKKPGREVKWDTLLLSPTYATGLV